MCILELTVIEYRMALLRYIKRDYIDNVLTVIKDHREAEIMKLEKRQDL